MFGAVNTLRRVCVMFVWRSLTNLLVDKAGPLCSRAKSKSPQGRPMSRFDFWSWTQTLKYIRLFVLLRTLPGLGSLDGFFRLLGSFLSSLGLGSLALKLGS